MPPSTDDAAEFEVIPIDVLTRHGGSKIEVCVRRCRSDGRHEIIVRYVNRAGRGTSMSVYPFEAQRLLTALGEASHRLRELVEGPTQPSEPSDAVRP